MRSHSPNLAFHVMDSTHSLQLAIRHGMAGDPEIEQLQKVLLTNKRPHPSISNMLRNSTRFRTVFREKQQEDALSVLENLGWAPQRMSSRARPYGRTSLRLHALLAALAEEAEHGHEKDLALSNLQQIASYKRLMLIGLLADLTHEHQRLVHETGTSDPDPTNTILLIERFKTRCKV